MNREANSGQAGGSQFPQPSIIGIKGLNLILSPSGDKVFQEGSCEALELLVPIK